PEADAQTVCASCAWAKTAFLLAAAHAPGTEVTKAFEWLEATRNGQEYGTPGSNNDDIWVAYAFEAAGKDPGAELALLLSRQNDDGGWGWRTNLSSDAWSTASVLLALPPADPAAIDRGFGFLAHQLGPHGLITQDGGESSESGAVVLH